MVRDAVARPASAPPASAGPTVFLGNQAVRAPVLADSACKGDIADRIVKFEDFAIALRKFYRGGFPSQGEAIADAVLGASRDLYVSYTLSKATDRRAFRLNLAAVLQMQANPVWASFLERSYGLVTEKVPTALAPRIMEVEKQSGLGPLERHVAVIFQVRRWMCAKNKVDLDAMRQAIKEPRWSTADPGQSLLDWESLLIHSRGLDRLGLSIDWGDAADGVAQLLTKVSQCVSPLIRAHLYQVANDLEIGTSLAAAEADVLEMLTELQQAVLAADGRKETTRMCAHFKKGHCKHGSTCNFSHGATATASAGEASKGKGKGGAEGICFKFRDTGKCDRDKCAYKHERSGAVATAHKDTRPGASV